MFSVSPRQPAENTDAQAPEVSGPLGSDVPTSATPLPRRKQPEPGTPPAIGRPDDQPHDTGPPSKTGRRRPLLLQNHHFRERGAASPPVA